MLGDTGVLRLGDMGVLRSTRGPGLQTSWGHRQVRFRPKDKIRGPQRAVENILCSALSNAKS